MRRRSFLFLLFILASGCLDWQASYDHAARQDCQKIINVDDRRACFQKVEEDSWRRRSQTNEKSDKLESQSVAR